MTVMRTKIAEHKMGSAPQRTFNITNPGNFGAQFGLPSINQAQAAISVSAVLDADTIGRARSSIRRAMSATRSAGTSPSYGQPKQMDR